MARKSKHSTKSTSVNSGSVSKGKLRLVSVFLLIVFLLVSGFLVRWQVVDYERFTALAATRFTRKEIPALRGDILARDGSVLSYTEPRFDIYVYMDAEQGLVAAENSGRQTRREFVEKVSQVLNMSESELDQKLNQPGLWFPIAESVSKQERDVVMSIPTDVDPDVFLDGLDYQETSRRIYPESDLAAHVVGFIGSDDFGEYSGGLGLEQYFDGILKPQAGISSQETDSNQNIIALSNNQLREARRGTTIKTTIDKNLQFKIEQLLADGVERYRAQSGSVIVIDPRTGEILALANAPTFDPNYYSQVEDSSVLGNIAITNPYEIGSVGKIFTMASAVDQGKVEPNTVVIDSHSGCQEIIEQRIICTYDKKPQGPLTATDAMIKSDNLALFATADLVGQEKLADYLSKFGMGTKTGVQLAGEDSGFIKPGELWNEADLAAYSYGHSYFLTTMQAAVGVAALANDGKRMEPLIVSQLLENGQVVRTYEPKVAAQVISPESTETMADILHQVYLQNLVGTRYDGQFNNYRIGMKSGTALIPYTSLSEPRNIPGYSNEVNTTYIGYDASDKNTFLMLVNLSEPQTTPKLSFNNARFLWLDIFAEIKDDLGVPRM